MHGRQAPESGDLQLLPLLCSPRRPARRPTHPAPGKTEGAWEVGERAVGPGERASCGRRESVPQPCPHRVVTYHTSDD
ncbi:hypothetical protein SLI_0304 [Streptomyces lividans 1326]|uniref:Uncharacterized protein n=1 Tax=Streptomyces lividans 1326 TaxID=1200984 RepID=A0A7U9DQ89_STRLI|nr:hypothetical protein SLI_0304 [Streptomyces lividans 1326]